MIGDYQTPERMAIKFAAVPMPNLAGKTVLDVGCDHGAWCWKALELGAASVLGLDRGRVVPGEGFVNLAARNRSRGVSRADFREFELGTQYHDFGKHDVVLLLNLYHHVYQVTGDHRPIWYWLWRHTGETLMVELPVSRADPVADAHVTHEYRESDIRAAAEHYFHIEDVGPGWVETRRVWRCYPKALRANHYAGMPRAGAGGATKTFQYANGRRMDEIEHVLGIRPIPGSLNVILSEPFDWDWNYYRAPILDVLDRGQGLDVAWAQRWARFYPFDDCYAFRFEGETYTDTFMELIADYRLRDKEQEIVVLGN